MGRKALDLKGKQFGGVKVIERAGLKNNKALWKCKCQYCGKVFYVIGSDLVKGRYKSCGCMHNKLESLHNGNVTHRMSKTRIYDIWKGMKMRCYDSNFAQYADYGGRGITVCGQWLGKNGFIHFYEDMKDGYADNLTLDRADANGPYCKENCRWVTMKEQCRNKRNNHLIDSPWGRISLIEASEKSGIKYPVLNDRVRRGWNEDKLFSEVIDKRRFVDTPWGTLTMAEAARKIGISANSLKRRMIKWDASRWFEAPNKVCQANGKIKYQSDEAKAYRGEK